MSFVLDNSVLTGWFVSNQADAYGDAIAARLADTPAWAPALLELEFTNVLRTACRRGAMTAALAREVIDLIATLPIHIDREVVSPASHFSLAMRYDLSSSDAAYLELALRRELPVATRDGALAEAAWAAGVGVVNTGV
ncbi:MAG: type II toxin-antitoxin system VapC family toxin [Gammaproteobacteria bacterium]|nr:type II toxin-antitoxin system VapC family toxin [Gammaproteobacteria bacterium]